MMSHHSLSPSHVRLSLSRPSVGCNIYTSTRTVILRTIGRSGDIVSAPMKDCLRGGKSRESKHAMTWRTSLGTLLNDILSTVQA